MRVEKVMIRDKPLVDAYRNDFSQVADFFEYDPNEPASYTKRYAFLQQRVYQRQRLVEVLTNYNARIGAGQKTLNNIQNLSSPETSVVITGQQAGIFTGPLYTIYKAITVLKLAEDLSKTGRPTLPVFWIASEDHDFQEIASIYFLNQDHQEERLSLSGETERRPIGKINLQLEVQKLIDQFARATQDTEFKTEMIGQLQRLAEKSDTLAEWFARVMTWLFSDTGLIFVDALEPEFRQLGQKLFLQILEKNDQITECLRTAEKELLAKGYSPQIHKATNQVHLCLIDEDDQRYPVDRLEESYQLRGKKILSKEELSDWLNTKPETVSTNVVTRPLFQDLLFPTIAYVGGPGEIAYYAQYKKIYQIFEMEMPIIYPRASLTLLEPAINRGLEKYQLVPNEIIQNYSEIRTGLLNQSDQLQIAVKFNELKNRFIPEYQTLIDQLSQLDGKFSYLGEKNLERIIKEINYMENKAQQQHRKNSEVLLDHLERLKINLYPDDRLQERRFNIFPYLFKYQTKLLDELLKLDLSIGDGHYLIYL